MIRHFEVYGLNDRIDARLEFHEDLNVLTGKNGSGKTSLLKLLWYVTSGHLDRVFAEVTFDGFAYTSDHAEIRAHKQPGSAEVVTLEWNFGDGWTKKTYPTDRLIRPQLRFEAASRLSYNGEQSFFFPTFRRIEGGFTRQERPLGLLLRGNLAAGMDRLQSAMQELSASLSTGLHQFVASISTHDIVDLLTREYADISEQVNQLHEQLSDSITSRIADYGENKAGTEIQRLNRANSILRAIEMEVSRISFERELAFQPFSVLSELIGQVFQYRGIEMTEAITLGEATEAISSDKLSAGEKQMLSFLCYNAFARQAVIFIDEPELSLHADWQRRLFPTLLAQGTNNQFIVATHSPFIYSKYPDKEIKLDMDRGNSLGELTGDE